MIRLINRIFDRREPIRQGDIALIPVRNIPKGLRGFLLRPILGLGEAEGHAHVVDVDTNIEWFLQAIDDINAEDMAKRFALGEEIGSDVYIEVPEDTRIVHGTLREHIEAGKSVNPDYHGALPVPAGAYKVVRQTVQRYDLLQEPQVVEKREIWYD